MDAKPWSFQFWPMPAEALLGVSIETESIPLSTWGRQTLPGWDVFRSTFAGYDLTPWRVHLYRIRLSNGMQFNTLFAHFPQLFVLWKPEPLSFRPDGFLDDLMVADAWAFGIESKQARFHLSGTPPKMTPAWIAFYEGRAGE